MESAPSPMRTIVVGSGAAGAPLAARLSEDPGRDVILLEAGSSSGASSELRDGGLLRGAIPGHPATWSYEAELTPGRTAAIARGRILGGSTTINGGYFMRATPTDFNRWAEVGGPEWAFENALPVLKMLENDLDLGTSSVHGDRGPVRVARPSQRGAAAAFLAAAQELGYPLEPDKSAGGPPGVGAVPSNIVDGVRVNTGMSYLDAERANLTIQGGTRVLRVAIRAGRAVGVETTTGFVEADEVVVAAGAVATPQLLMLSGVGPRHALEAVGIAVAADLPVGEAFSDHPNLALEWETRQPVVDWDAGYGFPTALNLDSAGVDRSLPSRPEGDIELLLTAKPLAYLLTGKVPQPETLDVMVALQHHEGRGRLSLRSADPLDPPRIEYRYLELEADRRRMRAAVRVAADLVRARAFARVFLRLRDLDADTLRDDARLDAWIHAHLGTALHMCGTAPMGSVVDGAGRVYGVDGLRVADTSILPTAPHRGPAATAVFIGELIARRMRAGT